MKNAKTLSSEALEGCMYNYRSIAPSTGKQLPLAEKGLQRCYEDGPMRHILTYSRIYSLLIASHNTFLLSYVDTLNT